MDHRAAPAASAAGPPARHPRPPSPAPGYTPCRTARGPETQRRQRRVWDTSGSLSPAPWRRPWADATGSKRVGGREGAARTALVERQMRCRCRYCDGSRYKLRPSGVRLSSELTRQCSRQDQSGETPLLRLNFLVSKKNKSLGVQGARTACLSRTCIVGPSARKCKLSQAPIDVYAVYNEGNRSLGWSLHSQLKPSLS